MAVLIGAVWEVRASGAGVSDNNGGAYELVTLFSGTDLVVDAVLNTKVTSVGHNFVAADVGTRLSITAGTGWTRGFYTILSVAANAATLASSPAPVGTTGGTWAEVGQDYSFQNAPQVAIGGGVVTTSITTNVITFTGATYAPTNADVGNYVQMVSGTNVTAASFFRIASVGATTWTMDANVVSSGTTVNAVGNMGGAILTTGKLAAKMLASNKAYLNGTFTNTTTTTFTQAVAGGGTGAAPPTRLIGYGAARGDSGHAQITLNATTISGIAASGAGFQIEQIDVDCGGLASTNGFNLSANFHVVKNCKVMNFTVFGINQSASIFTVLECEVTGGTAAASAGINCAQTVSFVGRCFVHDNLCTGISFGSGDSTAHANIVANNTGATSDGIKVGTMTSVVNNTIHNCGRNGINCLTAASQGQNWRNNILTSCPTSGAVGAITTALAAAPEFDGNAYFNNGVNRTFMDSLAGSFAISPYTNVRDVILTGSPYVGPTTGTTSNFALNNTVGAGAACQNIAAPATWPGNTGTAGQVDMGAVQTSTGGAVGIISA